MIPAVAAIAGSVIQSGLSWYASEKQYDRELEMIDKMNKYNSPEEQMKRFKAAGLSPGLMYSQGNSGNQSSHGTSVRPELTAPVKIDMLNTLNAMSNQNKLTEAQVDHLNAKTDNERMNINYIQHRGYGKEMNNLIYQLIHNMAWDEKNKPYVYNTDVVASLKDSLVRKGELTQSQIADIFSKIETRNSQRDLHSKQMGFIDSGIKLRDLEGQLKQMDVDFLNKIGVGDFSGAQVLNTLIRLLSLFK